jgi:hypothetical protein
MDEKTVGDPHGDYGTPVQETVISGDDPNAKYICSAYVSEINSV